MSMVIGLNKTVFKCWVSDGSHHLNHYLTAASPEQVDHELQEGKADLCVELQALLHAEHSLLLDVVVKRPEKQH